MWTTVIRWPHKKLMPPPTLVLWGLLVPGLRGLVMPVKRRGTLLARDASRDNELRPIATPWAPCPVTGIYRREGGSVHRASLLIYLGVYPNSRLQLDIRFEFSNNFTTYRSDASYVHMLYTPTRHMHAPPTTHTLVCARSHIASL